MELLPSPQEDDWNQNITETSQLWAAAVYSSEYWERNEISHWAPPSQNTSQTGCVEGQPRTEKIHPSSAHSTRTLRQQPACQGHRLPRQAATRVDAAPAHRGSPGTGRHGSAGQCTLLPVAHGSDTCRVLSFHDPGPLLDWRLWSGPTTDNTETSFLLTALNALVSFSNRSPLGVGYIKLIRELGRLMNSEQ